MGIQVCGYHPLGSGVLTGAYNDGWFSKAMQSKSTRVRWYQKNCAPINNAVRDVGDRRGKSAAYVAINWCVCKGIIPLCAARNREQVLEAVGGFEGDGGSWRLTESEANGLYEAAAASAEFAMGFELI
mmetsp:Transcript_23382/g.50629  ORF Transcript_23382/g.50629 Transcript_23382/m.50629 type:complete len:128 (-) Transcript_23382:879-1262(-)